jgi:hypothetical protein
MIRALSSAAVLRILWASPLGGADLIPDPYQGEFYPQKSSEGAVPFSRRGNRVRPWKKKDQGDVSRRAPVAELLGKEQRPLRGKGSPRQGWNGLSGPKHRLRPSDFSLQTTAAWDWQRIPWCPDRTHGRHTGCSPDLALSLVNMA